MASTASTRAIVLCGDSHFEPNTKGPSLYTALTESIIRSGHHFVNFSHAGYNSEKGLGALDDNLATKEDAGHGSYIPIEMMMIGFGSNDAAGTEDERVPIDQYTQHLSDMIDMTRNRASELGESEPTILLFSPPPPGVQGKWGGTREYSVVQDYARACEDLAQSKKVTHIDCFGGIQSSADSRGRDLDHFLTDGLHLAPPGTGVVMDLISSALGAVPGYEGLLTRDEITVPPSLKAEEDLLADFGRIQSQIVTLKVVAEGPCKNTTLSETCQRLLGEAETFKKKLETEFEKRKRGNLYWMDMKAFKEPHWSDVGYDRERKQRVRLNMGEWSDWPTKSQRQLPKSVETRSGKDTLGVDQTSSAAAGDV